LIWTAMRLGIRSTTVAILAVGLYAIGLTYLGRGPFSIEGLSAFGQVVLMKGGLIIITLTTLFLAVIVSDRKRADEELFRARDELEIRVEERTRKLIQEVTERKFIEIELIEAKERAEVASRAKSELMANMSHELRTPLNAIIGFSSTMMSEIFGPLNEKYLEYANDINSSGVHLLELINDILDISTIEAGKLELQEENTNVYEIVSATMQMVNNLAIEGNIHLTSTVDEGLPMLHADKRRLIQILINLLSNAIKFTLPGGKISLTASLDGGDALVFTVTDTGIGMNEEELAMAMSKFGQVDSGLDRKHEGTGLGLPLTKELVELHGGTFNIDSKLGKGSAVTVQFPPERTVVS